MAAQNRGAPSLCTSTTCPEVSGHWEGTGRIRESRSAANGSSTQTRDSTFSNNFDASPSVSLPTTTNLRCDMRPASVDKTLALLCAARLALRNSPLSFRPAAATPDQLDDPGKERPLWRRSCATSKQTAAKHYRQPQSQCGQFRQMRYYRGERTLSLFLFPSQYLRDDQDAQDSSPANRHGFRITAENTLEPRHGGVGRSSPSHPEEQIDTHVPTMVGEISMHRFNPKRLNEKQDFIQII